MYQRPSIDPAKTYHLMKFDIDVSDDSFVWAVRSWLKATKNKMDGNVVCGRSGDDYTMNKFTAMVPYVPTTLVEAQALDIYWGYDGELHPMPQHYNCRCQP